LTPSHALLISLILSTSWLAATPAPARDDFDDLVRRAKQDAEAGRYVAADSGFARAAAIGRGDDRAEALYLRAGVVRSGAEAEALYRRVVDEHMESDWGRPAALELAKIMFSMGRYEGARNLIAATNLCAWSDEACLFDGMAAVMLRRFDEAGVSLERVRRGRQKTWATLSLAEAEAGMGNQEAACERYASLARARVNPTAWYRYGECLEASGDADAARREYDGLADEFPQSPEAVRVAGKLAPPPNLAAEPAPGTGEDDEGKVALGGTGFTLQFGSFTERANAIKLASEIKKGYPAVRIDSELVNYREVFRVRYGQYATREECQAAGEAMSREIEERFTVMPITRATDD
jgi:tetratricopeptide (TPR) repeat protein